MRLLVAGRHAKVVARAAGAFADDLTIETAATKVDAIALLERAQFDLILACEKLGDGSGLEVLSHAVVNAPNTLRIFAARPSTLDFLEGELGLFGLFLTLPYPINFRQVRSVINLVRSCCTESGVTPQPREQVLRVPHVVLDSAWEVETPRATALMPDTGAVSALPPAPAGASPGPRPAKRIPGSTAFKRALARRNEAKRRSETNGSLVQVAEFVVPSRPTLDSRVPPEARKRIALSRGLGLLAAGIAAFLLTFFLRSSDRSIGPSALPLVPANDRPVFGEVVPWQAPPPQPAPTTLVSSHTTAPATAGMDVEAEAEAEFEQFANRTGNPRTPPANPSARPSEPPSYDESGMPIQQ